jgi:hypothetical protein
MLPPSTERIWSFLKEQPALAGFVLISGTALALRINHRRSDDLDLVWLDRHLPSARLEVLLGVLSQAGLEFQRDEDEAAILQFAEAGLDLRNFQQNFLTVDAVKVSFFVPDRSVTKVLGHRPEPRIRVATLPELFKTKCLVSAMRSKTRDWFDLYLLLRHHGFSFEDFHKAFEEADS